MKIYGRWWINWTIPTISWIFFFCNQAKPNIGQWRSHSLTLLSEDNHAESSSVSFSVSRAVLVSTESLWALSWSAQSQAKCCPGQRRASWAQSSSAQSQAERCPGQHRAKLSTVLVSTESSWALSWSAQSQAERCPGQCRTKLSPVPVSAESSWALS